ncbi:MAG: hypothetical protein EZS28_030396 [Streblomastix strix]|uniref:Uncharacterized protein n=1 Tax=Streblomastix strix TaxID=222440 RepID=A0A5J4UUH7_9EUKA|nr:MAG: hypothetical protein EZS28_030396 [Streblomastix strix]
MPKLNLAEQSMIDYRQNFINDSCFSNNIHAITKMTNNEDQYISSIAICVLAGLAECQDNHTDILSSNYPVTIARFISQKKDIIVHYTLQLIHNILIHGLPQTVGMAILFFPVRPFEELSEHTDPFIAENARAIISILKI